jgi:hypothetical protein
MSRKALPGLIIVSVLLLASSAAQGQATKSRVGKLDFDDGYPSKPTVDRLYEAMDFQRGAQAYLWALPLTGFAQWQEQQAQIFGARDGDVVFYAGYRDKLGILTSNATTPYVVGFYNLKKTGPLVIDYPAGPTAGGIADSWQRPITALGLNGPDKGAGGEYLVLGPGQSVDETDDYVVVQSATNNILHGFRILATEPGEVDTLRDSYRAYRHAARQKPPPTRVMTPEGREWSGVQPRGLAYWELVSKMLNEEPVHERDRMIVAMLKPLGIEKGKPFSPDERQKQILEEATVVGEAMARSLSYAKRSKESVAYSGTQWRIPIQLGAHQEKEDYTALDERAAWFFEAVTLSEGMTTTSPGQGQAYLSVHKDKGGRWLQGEISYRLRIPADPPVDQFWAVTIYDSETRCFMETEHEIAGRDSRMELAKNEDGSIFLYFGPEEPEDEDKKKNWIPTAPKRGWFAYFRLYAPIAPFFDKSWQLPDVGRVDVDDDLYGGGG